MRQNTLRVRLLGPVDLQLDNQPLPPLDSARAESLLAYLLLHRDAPQPRQRLAFLLWPGSSEGQAQTNLRKVLHTLRRALPDADRLIEIGPRTLRWRPDAPLWLDVEQFERAVADGRPAEAVGLYAGDLLEGRYDDWLAAERERLAGLHADALQQLARQHEQENRWPEAIRCAERLVARDPLREDYHRLLIRLCQASGDRARAVRAYHVCATTLEDELGIEPAPETRVLYESLVGRRSRPTESSKVPGTPPLVGRDDERARVVAAWHAAASGRPQLVLVTGEAGIGKTRLVEELRAHAGAVTAEARGYPAEGPLAYGVATAWLRSGPVAARVTRLVRPDLTELARLLPELARPGDAARAAGRGRAAAPAARRDRSRAAGRGRAAAADRGRRTVGRRPVAAPDPRPDPLGAVGPATRRGDGPTRGTRRASSAHRPDDGSGRARPPHRDRAGPAQPGGHRAAGRAASPARRSTRPGSAACTPTARATRCSWSRRCGPTPRRPPRRCRP